jgi:hypothetical protein
VGYEVQKVSQRNIALFNNLAITKRGGTEGKDLNTDEEVNKRGKCFHSKLKLFSLSSPLMA